MKTITFYSYKGGTSRSLLLANYARYLAYCGKSVVVLDFDLEAPGLHHKFLASHDLTEEEWERKKGSAGLLYYLQVFKEKEQAPENLRAFLMSLKFHRSSKECYFMPAGNAPTSAYAAKYLELPWKEWFPLDDGKPAFGVNMFLHLRDRIKEEIKADFLLIDSRTGITDIGSTAVAYMSNVSVCLFLCNSESFAGTRLMMATLERVRKDVNETLAVIPILTRIPCVEQDERNAVDQALNELGPLVDRRQLCVLHEETSLHVWEELLVGSGKALRESILLRDYFQVFYALDKDTAEKSKYNRFREILEKDRVSLSSCDDRNSFKISVIDAIEKRDNRVLKHAGKYPGNASEAEYNETKGLGYGYSEGKQYGKFASLVLKKLLKRITATIPTIQEKEEPIPEGDINWDLLGVQVGVKFDFCSELYYLTRYRALFLDVVQLGWIKTFTCFVREESTVHRAIKDANHQGKIGRAIYAALKARENDNIEVCLMGESAAADAAVKGISPILTGDAIIFRRDADQLWMWINEKLDKVDGKIIVCDHSVARKLGTFADANGKEGVFAYSKNGDNAADLVFKFDEDIPTGFLYPTADRKWRYIINQAVADALLEDPAIWGVASQNGVAKDLRDSGIEPLTWEDLKAHLVLGMNPDDAVHWLDQLRGGKKNTSQKRSA